MIYSNRKYLFGTKVALIHAARYSCCVTTAKDGLFKRQSAAIYQVPAGQLAPRSPVAKITFVETLSSADRLELHDSICKLLDDEKATRSLGEAIDMVGKRLTDRSLASKVVNLLSATPMQW